MSLLTFTLFYFYFVVLECNISRSLYFIECTGSPHVTMVIGTKTPPLSNCHHANLWQKFWQSQLPSLGKSWMSQHSKIMWSWFVTSCWFSHWFCLSEASCEDHKWEPYDCAILQGHNGELIAKYPNCSYMIMGTQQLLQPQGLVCPTCSAPS